MRKFTFKGREKHVSPLWRYSVIIINCNLFNIVDGENAFKSKIKHKSFDCVQCGKLFNDSYILKGHLKTHTPHFHCPFQNTCKRSFARSSSLKSHIEGRHSKNGKPFKCNICKRTFVAKNSLNHHINTQHTSTRTLYKCKECEKEFMVMEEYKIHVIYSHVLIHDCKKCDKRFFIRDLLTVHESIHNSIAPFICSLCDEDFKTDFLAYKAHTDLYTREASLKCIICKIGFGSMKNYINHSKSECKKILENESNVIRNNQLIFRGL